MPRAQPFRSCSLRGFDMALLSLVRCHHYIRKPASVIDRQAFSLRQESVAPLQMVETPLQALALILVLILEIVAVRTLVVVDADDLQAVVDDSAECAVVDVYISVLTFWQKSLYSHAVSS